MTVMCRAAQKVVRGLLRDFGELEHLQVSRKGLKNFVSSTDLRVEKILREELELARPGYGFIMEEQGVVEGTDPDHTWIIDPIDGTHNFIHGVPHFAISIALKKRDEIVAAITVDPVKNEIFCAEKGSGAYLNDKRLRVSGRNDITECFMSAPPGFYLNLEKKEKAREIVKQFLSFRHSGASTLDLAYVAAGRLDAAWKVSSHIWDAAGGILMVQEAGGYVTDLTGRELTLNKNMDLLVSNQLIHSTVVKLTKDYYKK